MIEPTKTCELCQADIVKEEPGDDTMHCPECDACFCKNCMPGHKFYVCWSIVEDANSWDVIDDAKNSTT